uniref:Uncharacterized protein n=1 Tax=uncultured prokaryote TaxID=198431 RepID=A0A0H5Q8F6_9ZZZZ|nr:hypothetical protein [uncultured prokaryote]
MATNVPAGYASGAFILTGPVGTPDFVTTCAVDASGGAGAWVDMADLMFECFREAFEDRIQDTYALESVLLTVGNDGPVGSVSSSYASVDGNNGGAGEVIAMSPILQKGSNVLGRKGRGRMFLPGMLSSTVVDANGDIASGVLGGLRSSATDFFDYLNDPAERPGTMIVPASMDEVGLPPVLLHSDNSTPTPCTSFGVAEKVGWVRKRLR